MKKFLTRSIFILIGVSIVCAAILGEIALLSSAKADHDKTLAIANLHTLREDAGILSSALSPNSTAELDPPYHKFLEDLDVFSKNPYVAENLQSFLADIESEVSALPHKITTIKNLRAERRKINHYISELHDSDFSQGSTAEKFQKISTDFTEISADFSASADQATSNLATLSNDIATSASDLSKCSAKNSCTEKVLKTNLDDLANALSELETAFQQANADYAEDTNINSLIKLLEQEIL